MTIDNERISLGEWGFGDRLTTEKDPVKSKDSPPKKTGSHPDADRKRYSAGLPAF